MLIWLKKLWQEEMCEKTFNFLWFIFMFLISLGTLSALIKFSALGVGVRVLIKMLIPVVCFGILYIYKIRFVSVLFFPIRIFIYAIWYYSCGKRKYQRKEWKNVSRRLDDLALKPNESLDNKELGLTEIAPHWSLSKLKERLMQFLQREYSVYR